MGDDDLTDGVGVDKTDVEDKGDEVVVQDYGLQVEVDGDEGPGDEVREETVEWGDGVLGGLAAGLHHVEGAGSSISCWYRCIFDTSEGESYLCKVLETRTMPP